MVGHPGVAWLAVGHLAAACPAVAWLAAERPVAACPAVACPGAAWLAAVAVLARAPLAALHCSLDGFAVVVKPEVAHWIGVVVKTLEQACLVAASYARGAVQAVGPAEATPMGERFRQAE